MLTFRNLLLVVVLGLCLGLPAVANDGKLDTFEKDANTPPTTSDDQHHHGHHHHDDDDYENPFEELCGDIFQAIFVDTGRMSWARMTDPDRCDRVGVPMRERGEPTIPLLRIDGAFRNVDPTVHALDLRTEAGYGPLALQFNYMEYHESVPSDTMIIRELFGLYRMSFGSDFELDFGGGNLQLNGDRSTRRAAVTLPVLIHPSSTAWGLEYRPAWADGVNDYDVALLYTKGAVSFKGGYRWVISPHDSLNGPYLGMSWRL